MLNCITQENLPIDGVAPSKPQRRITTFIVGILMAGLCLSNAFLIKQNQDLKAERIRSQPVYLKQGQTVPPMLAQSDSGEPATISYEKSNKTVLFVFAPGCIACEYTGSKWKLIEDACAHAQCRSFAVTLGNTDSKSAAFLSAHGLRSELLTNLSSQTRAAYQLSITPLTIVVDDQAKVEKIWPGAFNDDMMSDAEQYFGISLADKTSN
ncbi:MAG: hypothetical protein ABL999_03515 [Pyrinomonadaceae bacterium]